MLSHCTRTQRAKRYVITVWHVCTVCHTYHTLWLWSHGPPGLVSQLTGCDRQCRDLAVVWSDTEQLVVSKNVLVQIAEQSLIRSLLQRVTHGWRV
eukprot:2803005-Rhodomonas_salina.1